MKLKENQEKSATSRYRTRMHTTNSVCTERNSPTPNPIGHNAFNIPKRYITCTVQVNRTSWLRQNNDEKFCKITKNKMESGNITTQPGEIDERKTKVIAFVVNASIVASHGI